MSNWEKFFWFMMGLVGSAACITVGTAIAYLLVG